MLLITGLERSEIFPFSNNWIIETFYSFSETESMEDPNRKRYVARAEGNLRRSCLYKDNILISEAIENNPHYLSSNEIDKLIDEGEFIGDEFERTMNFPNGYVAKIEYWNSKNKQDPNLGIYRSKYMRMILLNETNHVIVDVLQENPHFGETPYTREEEEWYNHSPIL